MLSLFYFSIFFKCNYLSLTPLAYFCSLLSFSLLHPLQSSFCIQNNPHLFSCIASFLFPFLVRSVEACCFFFSFQMKFSSYLVISSSKSITMSGYIVLYFPKLIFTCHYASAQYYEILMQHPSFRMLILWIRLFDCNYWNYSYYDLA